MVMLVACSKKKEPLPQLTYSGEEPRVQNPLSPEDSRKHIQLPEGFEAVLFAAAPDIILPLAFTLYENGTLFVVHSQLYPHGFHYYVGPLRFSTREDPNCDVKADSFTFFATAQSLSTGFV